MNADSALLGVLHRASRHFSFLADHRIHADGLAALLSCCSTIVGREADFQNKLIGAGREVNSILGALQAPGLVLF